MTEIELEKLDMSEKQIERFNKIDRDMQTVGMRPLIERFTLFVVSIGEDYDTFSSESITEAFHVISNHLDTSYLNCCKITSIPIVFRTSVIIKINRSNKRFILDNDRAYDDRSIDNSLLVLEKSVKDRIEEREAYEG